MNELNTLLHNSNVYHECSEAIANCIQGMIPIKKEMTALEVGVGNSLLSFKLKDRFADIVMIDKSKEIIESLQAKIYKEGILNLWPINIDLEKDYFMGEFNFIYNQMSFRDVSNIELMLKKIHSLLRPNSYLAIADFFEHNGSSRGKELEDDNNVKFERLSSMLLRLKFGDLFFKKCYAIKCFNEYGGRDEYAFFLIVARS